MSKAHHVLAFVFATALGTKAMASGTTVEAVGVRDKSLVASFSSNVNVCDFGINSAVDVQWNSTVIKSNTAPAVSMSTALVTLHYVDSCTGDDLTMTGFLEMANGVVSTDLAKGHFDAVIAASTDPDLGPQKFAKIQISLNFGATGPATTIHDVTKSRDGAVVTVNDFTISSRPAVATGTVSGALPLSTGPKFVNLISGPSVSATIGSDANGTMTITRK